jgi:hypothetical protein
MQQEMTRTIALSIVLCCAMSSSANPAQTVVCGHAHKDGKATPSSVLVLRPRVAIWKEDLSSRRRSEGASEALQAGFLGVLSRIFADKGFRLRFDPIAMLQWEETPPNDVSVKALWDDYGAIFSAEVFSQPDCKRNLKISLQDDPKKVTDSNEFEVVVLARATGYALTTAAHLTDWYGANHLSFNIGVVDASTGRLLYYCESNVTGRFGGAPDPKKYMEAPDSQLSGPVQKCLSRYFTTGPKHR